MQLPNQYGPYLLLERISVGGMAEVFKAKEYGVEGFERTVAVKRILPHVAEDDEFIAMFKDEAKIAVQLNHGNIAQIYNLGNEQDSFYIALEYINGRDLRAIFQKCQQQSRPMPVAQACYVIMKICEGLDYAHNKKDKYQRELNIVHRDVSPPNILTSFEGEVKLIDFGVAKAAGRASRTQAGILKGKFGYMSPEQVRGMPLDRRSDVFSVSVVLFEMLTGHRLFQAETDFATLEKVRAVEVPRPSSLNPEIPKPLENIIYKGLAREPEQRYQSAIELHDELQAFMFAQGLFYSRKDLAAWMRQQYAREIELEKEKDKAQANIRPETLKQQQRQKSGGGGRKRKTMMMPTGGGPPPPPAPGERRRTSPPSPPPPPSRAAAAKARAPTAQHQSVQIGGAAARGKKRKTMVMTTQRPGNLPPPPGGGGVRRPKPGTPKGDDNEAPTIPLAEAAPKHRPQANPRPKGKQSPTMSYAAGAAPPGGDFDWDDEELETRLFEGESDAARDEEPPTKVPTRDNPRGAMPSPPAAPRAPVQAPPRAAARPNAAMTAIPAPANRTSVPPGSQFPHSPPIATRPAMPMAQPQPIAPPAPNPFPSAPAQQQQHPPPGGTVPMPQRVPPHMAGGMAPGVGPGHHGHVPMSGGQRAPVPPPSPLDYDERPSKGSAGPIVAILVAVIVLLVAGFGSYLLLYRQPDTTTIAADGTQTAPASDSSEAASGAEALGAITVSTTPADAKVFVDGEPVAGVESPFVITGIKPGVHKVKLEKEGFLAREHDVTVGAGPLQLAYTLEHKKVTLTVQSNPPGAALNLLVNGAAKPLGKAPVSYELDRQTATQYTVEAVLTGHAPQSQAINFTGSKVQRVDFTMVPVIAQGDPPTPVQAPPQQAPPEAAPPTPTSSPPKQRKKPQRRPKPRPRPKTKPSPTTTPSTPSAPPKSAAKTATLRIGTNPGVPPAEVYVDGRSVGKTPRPNVKVTPGRHTVKFKWPGGKEIKKSVTVASNASAIVKAG